MRYCFTISLILMIHSISLFGFAGGDGSSGSPYQVSNLAELNDVRNYLDSHFIQTADIDASETSTWNGGDGWEPIGSSAEPFTGGYNGQGHAISSLVAYRDPGDNIGLFGRTNNATLSNLEILDCDVRGDSRTGALVGEAIETTIENCGVTGLVKSDWACGGLVGRANNSSISGCYALSTIDSIDDGHHRGGLVGATQNGCVISNCYARGDVSGYDRVGGLVGTLDDTELVKCYATGHIEATGAIGGLVGLVVGTCSATDCYWDVQTTGVSTCDLGTGMDTSDMCYYYMYQRVGWDFVQETANGTDDVWDMDMSGAVNDGYPLLAWQNTPTCLQAPAGSGTSAAPYQIASLYNLFWISANDNEWDKHYLQTDDIDASDTRNWGYSTGFSPIGLTETNCFSGEYDGGEHTIDQLYIDLDWEAVALFGYTNHADIKNLSVTNAEIRGSERATVLVSECENTDVTNCHSSGAVQASAAGGLIGLADDATITKCSSSASVSGHRVGGLVDYTTSSTIRQCFATGDVQGSGTSGGLVAILGASSHLYDCYSTGDCHSTYGDVGGLVGSSFSSSSIDRCYSTGSVTGTANRIGGLVGTHNPTVTNSFWNTETSGLSTSSGGVGLTTAEMQYMHTFHGASWDFVQERRNGTADIWDMDTSGAINNGYPYLSWQDGDAQSLESPEGAGTADAPYLIATLYDLWWLTNNRGVFDKCFLQTADIDASDTQNWNNGFRPIGYDQFTPFNGQYHGDGHTISNLFIHRSSPQSGLFGAASSGIIENLGVVDASITNTDNTSEDTGILIGYAYNMIVRACHSSGSVVAQSFKAGGLIGRVSGGDCYDCYSHASVEAQYYAGGLIGSCSGAVHRSYATGHVISGNSTGGLVGYASANVIYDCFWDTQTSGCASSYGGGVGLPTAEMQTITPYIEAGWDFEGEVGNGGDDFWIMPPNDYPHYNTFYTPVITAVQDVANDQGRLLKVWWDRADEDDTPSVYRFYSLWREVEDTRAIDTAAIIIHDPAEIAQRREDDPRPVLLQQRNSMWTCLATIPSMGQDSYVYYAPSLVDSSAALQPEEYTSSYAVFFHFEDALRTSNIGVGYSVDNIPPFATRNLQVTVNDDSRNASLTLTWDAVTEGGLNGASYPEQNGVWYRVYAGSAADFACDETTLLETTQDTSLDVDVTDVDRRYFKVVVSDQP